MIVMNIIIASKVFYIIDINNDCHKHYYWIKGFFFIIDINNDCHKHYYCINGFLYH